MAHYAFIGYDNKVVKVIVGVDEDVTQLNGDVEVGGSSEAWEQFYQKQHLGLLCKRTSYHGNIRGRFAGVGYTYNADADVFVAPQPFASWTLDSNHDWQPPTPRPSTGGPYRWDEEELEWVAI